MLRIFILMTAVLTLNCANKNAPSTKSEVDSAVKISPNLIGVNDSSKKEKTKDYTPTNSFAQQPFLVDPTVEFLTKDGKYQIERETKVNDYDKNVIDTIISFRSGSDYFTFYKAKHATY